jgi:hypothetical protein
MERMMAKIYSIQEEMKTGIDTLASRIDDWLEGMKDSREPTETYLGKTEVAI